MKELDYIIKYLKNNFENSNLHHANLFTFNDLNTQELFINNFINKIDIIFNVSNIKIEVDLVDDISKANILNIVNKISYKWSKNYPRIIIIRKLDNLNIFSANSVLKILEEPPENTFFFLFTSLESKIIDTVKSRCMIFKINSVLKKEFNYFNKLNKYNIFLMSKKLMKEDKNKVADDINLWYKENFFKMNSYLSKEYVKLNNRFIETKYIANILEDILIIIWKVVYEKTT